MFLHFLTKSHKIRLQALCLGTGYDTFLSPVSLLIGLLGPVFVRNISFKILKPLDCPDSITITLSLPNLSSLTKTPQAFTRVNLEHVNNVKFQMLIHVNKFHITQTTCEISHANPCSIILWEISRVIW